MRVINIAEGTTVDGPGLRTSIYFAGCKHACPGCHNPESWPFTAGEEWSVEKLMTIIRFNHFNVTLTGGDPLYQGRDLLPGQVQPLATSLQLEMLLLFLASSYHSESQDPHCSTDVSISASIAATP